LLGTTRGTPPQKPKHPQKREPEREDRRNEVNRRIQTPTTKLPNFYENSDGRKKIAILTTDADSTQWRERGSFTLPQSFFFFSYLFPHPSETNREAL